MGAQNDQYFFIFGALVAAIFIFGSIAFLTDLFEFEDAKRTVMLDSYALLFESMDVGRGIVVSGIIHPSEEIVFVSDSDTPVIALTGLDVRRRSLTLRRDVYGGFEFQDPSRIIASSDGESIEYSMYVEPDCSSEPLDLDDISGAEIIGLRPDSLDDPFTLVVLATEDQYCFVHGLSRSYTVQSHMIDETRLSRFTSKEVLIIVV